MAGVRAIQKEKTRRALVNAAFNQLSAEKSFSNLSLREVAREAGIAPTSFYRHFSDMDELPNGDKMTKQCFWLNKKYVLKNIQDIIEGD